MKLLIKLRFVDMAIGKTCSFLDWIDDRPIENDYV